MNRRGFFSLMAGAAGAALVPWRGNVEPVLVMPPRWGWRHAELGEGYMRECLQYSIFNEDLEYRYDAIGRDLSGGEYQFHVQTRGPNPDVARRLIADRFRHDGLIAVPPMNANFFQLALPRNMPTARYV